MTLLALTLSEAQGQPFAAAFSQQWVLYKQPIGDIPSFETVSLGGWTLAHGQTLPISFATSEGLFAVVMGQAVNADGQLINSTVLSEMVEAASSASDLADNLCLSGGRYAFIIIAPDFERLYMDPSGCLGAVYDPKTGLVASTLYMALERPVVLDTVYPLHAVAANGSGGRYAFGFTPDEDVKRLLCNHYLDLKSFGPIRHWPNEDTDFSCPMTMDAIEERLDIVIKRHHEIISALATDPSELILPVSGGDDSRVLLALSANILDKYDMFFVHRTNKITQLDVTFAQELAQKMDIELAVIDAVETTQHSRPKRFSRKMNERRRLAMGVLDGGPNEKKTEIEVRNALPMGATVLRGNVTDVSKAVLWRGVGVGEFLKSAGKVHSPQVGVRLLMLGDEESQWNPTLQQLYSDWMQTLPQKAHCRAFDFASLEHFRTHGQGALFYATNKNFYQTPSSDRTILEALISIPPHIRDRFYVNDRIIERMAPQVSDVPFTRGTANEIRNKRPELKDLLAQSPDRL